jgi:dimethylhistidine N-methyltransferase
MSVAASPATFPVVVDERIASTVSEGLTRRPRRLPAWLFYDAAGSRLFDAITQLPEYYLTRTERSIFAAHAEAIIAEASGGARVRVTELGAGSADKTRLLLKAAVDRQRTVVYEPVDVSLTALSDARDRIHREIPGVKVVPRVMDYTDGDGEKLNLGPVPTGDRRLVLYIGSSIGNFEPHEARRLLRRVRAGLSEGDTLLLGVDLVKDEAALLAAYDDAAGITAKFNRNLLVRLNRELDADFDPQAFDHRAVWNAAKSRMEMHLVSRAAQRVRLDSVNLVADFALNETIHTENSYKYKPGQPEALLAEAGFKQVATWTDAQRWFAVCLGKAI